MDELGDGDGPHRRPEVPRLEAGEAQQCQGVIEGQGLQLRAKMKRSLTRIKERGEF